MRIDREEWRQSPTQRGYLAVALALAMAGVSVPVQAQSFVAGTAPDRRPEGAPVLSTYEKSPAWFERALTGVSKPIPPSLGFLESQGAWFTPFTRPGMPGLYDIRGLHAERAKRTGEGGKPNN